MSLYQRIKSRFVCDRSTREFIRFNRKQIGVPVQSSDDNSVILIDYFFQPIVAYRYSVVTHYLRQKTGASVEYFYFHRHRLGFEIPNLPWKKVFESMGARPGLSFKWASSHEKEAREYSQKTFAGFKTKWDVVNLAIDGIVIGDLLYDSYLREGHFTVDLKDARLRALLYDAYLILRASQKYFREKKVRAFFPGHTVYIQFGIPARVAAAAGVPVFIVRQFDYCIFKVEPEDGFARHPYMHFKSKFDAFPEAEKVAKRAKGRKILENRLAGIIDQTTADMNEKGRTGLSGYLGISGKPILKTTGRPRISLMLNCFFDAPHTYRRMLFPDFWEWVAFTLTQASETGFDWYVKPRPAGFAGNDLILEEFKKAYPKINFLERTSSNNQIVAEGISAMFTVHGTAGHEFAYMGIPVVNSGDNPHINYSFNLHPQTLAEYEQAIRQADQLKPTMEKNWIEEFAYMNYLDFLERNEQYREQEFDEFVLSRLNGDIASAGVYEFFMRSERSAVKAKETAYFDWFFKKHKVIGE